MRAGTMLTSIALVALMSLPGMSQYSARESFEYPQGSSLDTLLGTAGNGWAGSWDLFDGNENVMTASNEGFVYSDLSVAVPHSGMHLIGANPTAWGWQRYGRYLSKSWPDSAQKIYWISSAIELQTFTDNGWAGLGLYDSTTEGPLFGHEWGNPLFSLGQYDSIGRTGFNCNEGPQWLVVRIDMSGDTLAERNFMWISPDPAGGEPDTTKADARGSRKINNGFNRIVVHFGGEGVGMSMAIDEIRLGTSWGDVSSPLTGVSQKDNLPPIQFALSQNFPNPFNPTTKIRYTLKSSGEVRLSVYDLMGRQTEVLVDGSQNAGTHDVVFSGAGLTSGIYFYRLQTTEQTITKKMMLLK